jgi:hypothetical protein
MRFWRNLYGFIAHDMVCLFLKQFMRMKLKKSYFKQIYFFKSKLKVKIISWQKFLPEFLLKLTFQSYIGCVAFIQVLKGQSHETFGEMRVWGLSLGHN